MKEGNRNERFSTCPQEMLCHCGDNCYVIQTDAADGSLVDKISACVTSGSPATGSRPQNREPSHLVGSLRKKMILSYDDEDKMFIRSVADAAAQVLSADARSLLDALERKKIDHRSPRNVFC